LASRPCRSDAEGQVVRGRGKGVRYVLNDIARVVLQVFEWADEGDVGDAAPAVNREGWVGDRAGVRLVERP
jgi:hypothetical protein